jgi:hypothetical protein
LTKQLKILREVILRKWIGKAMKIVTWAVDKAQFKRELSQALNSKKNDAEEKAVELDKQHQDSTQAWDKVHKIGRIWDKINYGQ